MNTATTATAASGRRSSIKWILMLGALAALPAITTDMYLPSLPAVAQDLEATQAAAQFTMSGMLIGAGVGQLVIGPFSDRFGRRLPLLIGISLHVVTSILCSVTPDIASLIGLRVCQGFFNAAASVVAIAVIRDLFVGSEARGKAAAIAYTLIETAKLNGVDPQTWLADALARIADHPINRVADLLPWSLHPC